MLSILISVYNYDCRPLVSALYAQAQALKRPYEILLLDDCSSTYVAENRTLERFGTVVFYQNERNRGLSASRNKLASLAKHPYLLFLDADAMPPDDLFLQRYTETLDDSEVLIGGICYSDTRPADSQLLRWVYGHGREASTARQRQQQTLRLSFNFVLRKDIQIRFPFNEHIQDYGHEDTLLGIQMQQNGVLITHIDNPMIHMGLEESSVFLTKSLIAAEKCLRQQVFQQKEVVQEIKLFRSFQRVKSLRINGLLSLFYRIFHTGMKRHLLGKHPSLFIYDVYRLSYLCRMEGHVK